MTFQNLAADLNEFRDKTHKMLSEKKDEAKNSKPQHTVDFVCYKIFTRLLIAFV